MRIIILLLLITSTTFASELITGKVVKVTDGDTIKILVNNKQIKIRFAQIDCPEKKQPWNKKAKTALADMIAGKIVQVEEVGIDWYKRIVGKVFYDGENINRKVS